MMDGKQETKGDDLMMPDCSRSNMSSFMCLLIKIKTCTLFQATVLRTGYTVEPNSGVTKGKVPETHQLLPNSLPNHTGHSRGFVGVEGTPTVPADCAEAGMPVTRLIGICGP